MRTRATFICLTTVLALSGCGDDDCFETKTCAGPGTGGAGALGGAGGQGGSTGGMATGGGGASTGGTGGAEPCDGACTGNTPFCDEGSNQCVACLDHTDCTGAQAAKCDAGACTTCDDSAQCAGITGTEVCGPEGACVECGIGEDSACANTCNLLANTCSDVPVGGRETCQACTHDDQCELGNKCVPMDYDGSFHGYYCLKAPSPGCDNPFTGTLINATSLAGEPAQNYCGINTDLATCEAVYALQNDWRCSGTNGMCSPDGIQPEQPIPSALCRHLNLGTVLNRCTYQCAGPANCPGFAPGNTCGDGPLPTPPDFCGG